MAGHALVMGGSCLPFVQSLQLCSFCGWQVLLEVARTLESFLFQFALPFCCRGSVVVSFLLANLTIL